MTSLQTIPWHDFTSLDIAVGVLALFFLLRGVWIGFVRQLAAFFALVGSYLVAGSYSCKLMPWVDQFVENPKAVFVISFLLLFVAGALVCILLGNMARKLMEITLLGWFDRLLGLLLGGLKGFVVASLLFMILASTLSSTNELLTKSFSTPYLSQGALLLQQAINDPELCRLFLPKEPAIPEKKEAPVLKKELSFPDNKPDSHKVI